MGEILEFLPKEGVRNTLYLYSFPQAPPVEKERWDIVAWDGRRYNCHSTLDSLEAARLRADELPWAEGWPRIACTARNGKTNPCVKVEFEYKDGRTQSLTGPAAENWLKNVNDIVAAGELRYGQTQMNNHPWEFTRRNDG